MKSDCSYVSVFTLSSHSSFTGPCTSGEAGLSTSSAEMGEVGGPEKSQPVRARYSLAMVTSPAVDMWPPRLANQIEIKA